MVILEFKDYFSIGFLANIIRTAFIINIVGIVIGELVLPFTLLVLMIKKNAIESDVEEPKSVM